MAAVARPVWIVNDIPRAIAGSRTLWDDLLDWIPGAVWASSGSYPTLSRYIRDAYFAVNEKPVAIVRNASYFGRIDCPCPTVALLQDIFPSFSPARAMQVEVCRDAAVVVVNSSYTASKYPELACEQVRIIPLPVDFDLFKPEDVRKEYDVCWVGADSEVKGYDTLLSIIGHNPDLRFLVIRKDLEPGRHSGPFANMEVWGKMGQGHLAASINRCRTGLCTSREETQHLAGIEMAGCGLPVVATPVGVYADERNSWALKYDEPRWFGPILRTILDRKYEPEDIRSRVMAGKFTKEACREAWLETISNLAS